MVRGKRGHWKERQCQWQLFTGKKVPYAKFTYASSGSHVEVFGTENGAIRAESDYFYCRTSRRCLPNNWVKDIAVDKDGTAWIATGNGIGQIIAKEMTYKGKAAYFTKQVEEHHNRMGFICQSQLLEQFNIATSQLAISDNDGQYSAMEQRRPSDMPLPGINRPRNWPIEALRP